MIPAQAFDGAVWTDVAGFVLGALLIASELGVMERLRNRRPA
jgi:hypothetical protein